MRARADNLISYFEQKRDQILEFIRWLVEQESMSRVPEATSRIAENLADRITQLGASVELLSDPSYGATVRARFGSDSSRKQLLLVGHLDTVWPIGTLAERPFRRDGDRAFGPGIFDMKAGVAIATFAMRALSELGRSANRPVTMLMTCDEETGSHFSRHIIEEEATASHAALVLEPPIPGGKVKTKRKGVGEFELIVRGRAAHAGNDPRTGVNAIVELAHQILKISSMNDPERGITLNVGLVCGGLLSNVVPAEARAVIDLRFDSEEDGLRAARLLNSLEPILEGASLEVRGQLNRPPMRRTPQVAALFEHAKGLAAELGFQLEEGSVGGGSDGNFIAAMGVPVLDGLGVDGAGAHAEHEHIIISDIPRRAALLVRLIETI
jgi:glutamate carboxypeptidase